MAISSNVDELLRQHFSGVLSQYLGNLQFAMKVLNEGLLPAPDDPLVTQHQPTLQKYLEEIGSPVRDDFLLRFGLIVPGMQRGQRPPIIVLNEDRGGFVKRRQREASGQIERLQQALSVGRQFVNGISDDTATAIRQLAEVSLKPLRRDAELIQRYAKLSDAESIALSEAAVEFLGENRNDDDPLYELGIELLQCLTNFRSRLSDDILNVSAL